MKQRKLKKAIAFRSTWAGEWEWNVRAGELGRGQIIGTACEWQGILETEALQILIDHMTEKGYEVRIYSGHRQFSAALPVGEELLRQQAVMLAARLGLDVKVLDGDNLVANGQLRYGKAGCGEFMVDGETPFYFDKTDILAMQGFTLAIKPK